MDKKGIKTQVGSYMKTKDGILFSTNQWDIGLLEAIQKETHAVTVFKARELPRLPIKLIQINKPIAWLANKTLIRAQAGDFVASYRRGNGPEGGDFVARLDKETAEKLIVRYRELAQEREKRSIREVVMNAPHVEVYSETFAFIFTSDKTTRLYPKSARLFGKNGENTMHIFRFEDDLTFLIPQAKGKKRQLFKVSKGQTIAITSQPGSDVVKMVQVMPEDVNELIHSLRRADRLNRYSALDVTMRKVSRRISSGFQRKKAKQKEK